MSDDEVVAATTAVFVVVYLVTLAIAYVVGALLMHFTFRRLGIASWRAWVPFVNYAAILQAGGYSGWWAAGLLVPGLNIVTVIFAYISYYRLGKGLKLDDTLNILSIIIGFWVIVVLVTKTPFDHRLTGVQTRQPEQLAAIAQGGLIDPATPAPGYGYPPPGQAQNPYGQQNPYGGPPPQISQNPYGQQNPYGPR